MSLKEVKANLNEIADDYAALSITQRSITKVGVVGEIYVKYSHWAITTWRRFCMNRTVK